MERFFDDADFTASHDEIFEHLIAHWTDYILPIATRNEDFPIKILGSIRENLRLMDIPRCFQTQ
jgi:hypothetical protein